jgi:hypothetical protein
MHACIDYDIFSVAKKAVRTPGVGFLHCKIRRTVEIRRPEVDISIHVVHKIELSLGPNSQLFHSYNR